VISRTRTSGEVAVRPDALERPTAPSRELPRWVPLAASATLGALALIRFGPGARGLVDAVFLAALGALAVIDYERHLLPNRIVLPSAALVFALQLAFFPDQAVEWTIAAVATFLGLLMLALIRPGGLGMGDVKLGLLLGAGLGSQVVGALLIGFLALWPFALWALARGGAEARKHALPLGPALAFGAAVVVLAG
jgi:leader peptidase (prepilin peptidase) / N-methyltransferase